MDHFSKRKQDKIETDELRVHCVSVRLNNEELDILERVRGKKMKGEALRLLAFYKLPPVVPEFNRHIWTELSRAASNINQIAVYLNGGAQVH